MTRFLLVRHGETEWNNHHRYQGQVDTKLNQEGLRQAALLRDRLAREPIDALYTSDLRRAAQTAAIIGEVIGRTIESRAALREISFGVFEGLTYEEVQQRYPEAVHRWVQDPAHEPPPGGETLLQLAQRTRGLVEEVCQRFAGGTVLLVAHNGSLKGIILHLLGFDLRSFWRLTLGNASLSVVRLENGRAALTALNDRCHLR